MRKSVLMVVLLAGLVACSSPGEPEAPDSSAPEADATPAAALSMTLADFMIDPLEIETSGPTVTIDVTNRGPTPHNLSIRGADGEVVMATDDLSVGDMATITGDLEPGEYTTFCSLAGHESLGMSGTLTVSGP